MSTSNTVLVLLAVALALGLLIWFIDYAAVARMFGEPPMAYWRLRHNVISAVGPLFYPPQMYAATGIAFVCLSMWAYAHPGAGFSWEPPGGRMEVYWYTHHQTALFGDERRSEYSPDQWNVRWARSDAKELIFERKIPYQDERYGEQNHIESVSITARPYWAKNVWPRMFYRLEVSFPFSDKLRHPDAGNAEEGKNPHISYYHGVEARMLFTINGKTHGPIIAEQGVQNYNAVSYNRWAIRPLLDAMKAATGPIGVRVEFWRDGKLLDTRSFDTPGQLEPQAIDVLQNKAAPHFTTILMRELS